jgi:hypothetical protein
VWKPRVTAGLDATILKLDAFIFGFGQCATCASAISSATRFHRNDEGPGGVREAIRNAIPAQRKKIEREPTRLVREVVLFIHSVLEQDPQAPRKQRHTAQRVFERVREEMPQQQVSAGSVRLAVQEWKQQRQQARAETYISQEYEPSSPRIAGLLFRDLLDRFHGDVARAVGAYNGGPGNPNPLYEEGVRMVADYARRVMEHAAALNGVQRLARPF